jgi:uncharacterized membrane protein
MRILSLLIPVLLPWACLGCSDLKPLPLVDASAARAGSERDATDDPHAAQQPGDGGAADAGPRQRIGTAGHATRAAEPQQHDPQLHELGGCLVRQSDAMTARRTDQEEGAIAPMVALLLASFCGFAGLAVEAGLLQDERRALQASVDAAALSAARAPDQAQAIGNAMLNRNGRGTDTRTIVTGTYQDDPALAATQRFAAGAAGTPNAVRVVAQRSVPLGLTRVLGGPASATVAAAAVAEHRPIAGFAIGSTLASLNAGILNQVLGSLIGGSLNLDAVAYSGLWGSNLQALAFSNALATSLNLGAGSYRQLLDAQTTVGRVLSVAATALGTSAASGIASTSTSAVATTLSILAQAASGTQTLRVGDLLNLAIHQSRGVGDVQGPSYADLGVNAFDLVTSAVSLGGANAVTAPVGVNVPGIANISTRVMVVEPMQSSGSGPMAMGPVGTRVETAQTRVLLSVQLLSLINGGLVTLPLLVEVAPAQGELLGVSCEGEPGMDSEIRIRATTGVGRAQIGQVNAGQFASPGASFGTLSAAPILNAQISLPIPALPLLGTITLGVTISARASATVGSGSRDMTFSPADIAAGMTQSAFSTGLTSSLIGSLGSSLVLTPTLVLPSALQPVASIVNAAAAPLVSTLLGTIASTLAPVLAALDPVLDQVLAGVGVQVGSAAVRATGVRCGVASLVL